MPQQEDAGAVRAIKDAGAVILGKKSPVEMSYGLTGHNARHGQVKNLHARDRSVRRLIEWILPHLVAAGIVPASLGGDTVGSIRVPASLCGVVGSRGLRPDDGLTMV